MLGFDKTLDFRGAVGLSPEMSDRVRGRGGKFFVGRGGRVEIPLVISGPVASPAFAVDTDALARGVAGGLIRGPAEKVSGASSVPDNAARAETGKKQDGEGQPRDAEGLFRKLLSRR